MLDAGVPLKKSVAGVAMGLLLPYEMKKGSSDKVCAHTHASQEDVHVIMYVCM
jgi:polyribonucleotide nucleotidyltransferase